MKQFSKIKHFADKAFISKQDVPKPDRTEVLSEDLQDAERKIELIKQTCESTAKKVSACLQCPSKDGQPLDKRINKVPEVVLGLIMIKHGQQLGSPESGSVLGGVLTEAGEIETKVGHEMVSYEVRVEELILGPLHKLVEQDLPKIEKLKRTLSKLTSDMDTARAKLSQASRHSMSASTTGKIDNIKDDLEETQQKVEQCRDNLAAEMYQLIAREAEISKYIVNFLQYQRDYHRTVFSVVDELLPNVESILANSYNKPVYGVDLDEHLNATNHTIAYTLELCVCGLMVTGLEEEGLFRIAGSASKVKKLKAAFDAGYMHLSGLITEFSDPHVIGNALKCYLRELPTPLLTFGLYQEWMEAVQISNNQQKLQALKMVVNKLPKSNFDNLRYLIKFLFELSKHQGINKMTPANIAIVIGPNLLWMPSNPDDPSGENTPMGMNMTMTHLYTSLVDQLVTHADYFFPEEIDFFVTCARPTEAELRSGGANGILEEPSNHAHSESEGLASAKRSQSSSSLEDHNNSPPQGSPKPVLRLRKNKPAPVPPPLVKSSTSVSPQSKSVISSEVGSVKPTQAPSESSSNEAAAKRLSATKREAMWIPPSPNQMNNRRHLGSSGSVSGGNILGANNDPPSAVCMKVVPPKPPQPQFSQHPSQDAEFKSAFGDGIKISSQTQTSTLRHKSSFNSGNTVESSLGGSPGYSVNANQSNSSLQYSHSLPRHFHTENSYKNQRAPRPPSNFYAIPTVPTTHLVANSTTTATSTAPQNPPDINPKNNNVLPQQFSNQSGNSYNSTNESTDPSVSELPDSAPGQISPTGSRSVGSGINPGAGIGFERVETEVRRLSETNTSSSVSSVQMEKTIDNTNGEESTPSNINPTPLGEGGRPVPAPRSSLLLQNVNVGKEKEKEIPIVKGRPTLMAKPRDLAKRSHMNSAGGSVVTNTNSTGSVSDSNVTHEVTTSGQTPASGLTIPLPVDVDDVNDSGLSDGTTALNIKNGGIKDKNLPPQSPRAPYRPPRPQPPPPPKSKAESTDL